MTDQNAQEDKNERFFFNVDKTQKQCLIFWHTLPLTKRFKQTTNGVKSGQVKSSQVKQTLVSHIEILHCGLLKRIQVGLHTLKKNMGRNKRAI